MKVIRKSNHDHEDWRGDQHFVAQRLSRKQAEAVAEAVTSDRSIEVRRASPVGDARVPLVTINIHGDVPELPPFLPGQTVAESLSPLDTIYQQDATAIANALHDSLPGGTFDRLIVELLKMKVSHFRVPWSDR